MKKWTINRAGHSLSGMVCAFLCGLLWWSSPGLAQPTFPLPDVSIATQLIEVQRGSIAGREYLTLHIGGREVGPSTCRSNILRMDTSGTAGVGRQEEIESIALSAMLTAATVMITVPLDVDQCVDGKPTFNDLYLLAPAP